MKRFICINLNVIAGVNLYTCHFGLQAFTPVILVVRCVICFQRILFITVITDVVLIFHHFLMIMFNDVSETSR